MDLVAECKFSGCSFLVEIASYVGSLGFNDAPNYKRLRFMFTKVLLDQDVIPKNQLDWMQNVNSIRQISERSLQRYEDLADIDDPQVNYYRHDDI